MEQPQNRIVKNVKNGVVAVLWVTGLLMAGSDNIYMPWTNGIGLLIFLCACISASRRFRRLENRENERPAGNRYRVNTIKVQNRIKSNRPVRIYYA